MLNSHVLSYFTDLHGKVKVFLAQGGKTFHPAPHIKKSVRQALSIALLKYPADSARASASF